MMSIESRKITIIQQILSIDNEFFTKELETKILQLLSIQQSAPLHKPSSANQQKPVEQISALTPPIVDIRKNVSLDKIVTEQQTMSLNYSEIQAFTKATISEDISLKALLEALN